MFSNNSFLDILYSILIFAGATIAIMYFLDKILKLLPYLRKIFRLINNNLYLFLLPFPILYLIYNYYQVPHDPTKTFFAQTDVAEYLKSLSILFFSGGIFSATVKLINSMVIFKNNFQKIILSEDFDEMMRNKFEVLALSDQYLLKRTDLHEIWTRVTTCKYQQNFPALKDSIINKMENEFFTEKMLSYYYRNFNIQVNLELMDNDIVKITEISNFQINAHSSSSIRLEFKINSDNTDDGVIYTKIMEEDCKLDNAKLRLNPVPLEEGQTAKAFYADLAGKKEYDIQRKIEMTQNINDDRVFSFFSSIIIDNMSVSIKYCDKLNVFFSPVSKNKFQDNNQIHSGKSFVNREVLLPGEKFKIFIFKKS